MTPQLKKNIMIGGGLLIASYGIYKLIQYLQSKKREATLTPEKPYIANNSNYAPITSGKFPLKMGSRGLEVAFLQQLANMPIKEWDGIWGAKTEKALLDRFGKNEFSEQEYLQRLTQSSTTQSPIVDWYKQAKQSQANVNTPPGLLNKFNLKF
jgi:hypothetical protein